MIVDPDLVVVVVLVSKSVEMRTEVTVRAVRPSVVIVRTSSSLLVMDADNVVVNNLVVMQVCIEDCCFFRDLPWSPLFLPLATYYLERHICG